MDTFLKKKLQCVFPGVKSFSSLELREPAGLQEYKYLC